MAMEIDPAPRTALPGFGLPVNELKQWGRGGEQERLPHAIADNFASYGVTARERRMLEFINQITDKPAWNRKIFDKDIIGKWKEEAVRWDDSLPEKGDWWLSEEMFRVCVLELEEKAKEFETTRFVAVLDAEATIVKSDEVVSQELQDKLKDGVRPLENVPERLKDWHPDSGEQVLDLVHPSLFPVVYGLSRVLPTGTVPLEDSLSYSGNGETTAEFTATYHTKVVSWGNEEQIENAWGSFQWLPSNVKFTANGAAKIDSYINNLHPHNHKDLYMVLEQFVDVSIPLWNECLSWFQSRVRFHIGSTSDEDYTYPDDARFPRELYHREAESADPNDGDEEEEDDEDDDDDDDDDDENWAWDHNCHSELREWRRATRILNQPEPEFEPQTEHRKKSGARPIDLRKDFADRGIQVIFKLANIHLTPDDPAYHGGSWHVEGSLNEHICATALYYYDCENVTDSHLAFRQSYDTEELTMLPAQSEYNSLEAYFDVEQDGSAVLDLGSVLTRQSRLLAFPNIFQHQVQPFSLADESKPGHRKILAMFLVDPHVPILSTANVPPQRRDWWAEEVRKIGPFAALPKELFDMVVEAVEGFPLSWDAAVDIRKKLMGERGMVTDELVEKMEHNTFSFCEH
ncbi:hypothetical protein K505DRAFT_374880 [Melanomma pulvis-pyrius CBS 109.77]|uniref:DUF1665 domain-containing protein n=1 Tax=Melanomma pulvis-pyrius CBS 109.77 TaxID=1314802 RepID=A0A6A6XC83_9PLEO|nr:hypothetical protein K505DRAFT_374880 [Melanomma pulvis-pyrius CBS 109.77]